VPDETGVNDTPIQALERRLQRLEDERAVQRVVIGYGPAADAGLATRAGALWLEDGLYDWDAKGKPHRGREEVDRMLRGDVHQGLIRNGAAHLAMPPLVEIDGDQAVALTYSLVFVRREGGYDLWRLSANRWDLERHGSDWRIRCRTNRQLDDSGGGRTLLADTINSVFGSGGSETGADPSSSGVPGQ
jgi:hypothetical protein